jgi:hypothetical protein
MTDNDNTGFMKEILKAFDLDEDSHVLGDMYKDYDTLAKLKQQWHDAMKRLGIE